ncbi:MAG TPA: MarR family transcriptional regulator [Solirubrobacteraceae bacterium]|nr:MarR family transcriptional regulator [Solirubrobacteraceae bacterium]
MPAPADELANQLRPLLIRLGRELRKEAIELGVTGGQVTMLYLISQNPGIGLRELAEHERIATPTASGLIDRLERAQLVRRVRSQTDRRRVGLTITPAGRRKLTAVRARRTAWLTERLERLEPAQRAAVERALAPLGSLIEEGGRVHAPVPGSAHAPTPSAKG